MKVLGSHGSWLLFPQDFCSESAPRGWGRPTRHRKAIAIAPWRLCARRPWGADFQPTLRGNEGPTLTLPYLDVPGGKLGSMVRINGLFDLLVNGIFIGVINPLIRSIYQLPGTSKYLYVWLGRGCVTVLFWGCIFFCKGLLELGISIKTPYTGSEAFWKLLDTLRKI